jgi:hypothetical protein
MNRAERIEQMVQAHEKQLHDLSDAELIGEWALGALRDEAIGRRLEAYREKLEAMDDEKLFGGAQ